MKRINFIKTIGISCVGIGLVPHLSFTAKQETYTIDQLIGKGNPAIVGKSYTSKMHTEAALVLKKMQKAAAKEGIEIEVVSAYRSFKRQKEIYEAKYKKYIHQGLSPDAAIKKIIEYSTIPGTSRHHWGTDIDIIQKTTNRPSSVLQAKHFHGDGVFCKLKDWLTKNASTFGFYEVYTDNPSRKGFKYEPWHFSYAPVSIPMLKAYKELDIKKILSEEKILGSEHFTDDFITTYRNQNILDINPKLLL